MEEKNELYYDAMEYLSEGEPDKAIKLLIEALSIDSEFVDAYVGLTAVYREVNDFINEKKCADLGFKMTFSR